MRPIILFGTGAIGHDETQAQIDRMIPGITCTCGARATVEYLRVWRAGEWLTQRVVRCQGIKRGEKCPPHMDEGEGGQPCPGM